MQLDTPDGDTPIRSAFVSAVISFALAQSHEGLAKILGFFHLAEGRAASVIELQVDSVLGVTLRLEMGNTSQSEAEDGRQRA